MSEKGINGSLSQQLTELEISSRTFQAGGIYITSDTEVKFPQRNEIVDKPRLIVVLGDNKRLCDPLISYVSAAPVTTAEPRKAEAIYDLPVSAGTGNLKYDSLIKAGMVQPFPKTKIGNQIGILDDSTMTELKATIFMNLGLGNEGEGSDGE